MNIAETMKEKINMMGFIKTNFLCFFRDTIKKMKIRSQKADKLESIYLHASPVLM
jgi:hypothetical protein